MEHWTELRTLLALGEQGTLTGTAKTLNLHRATVERHISILENAFGKTLFLRNSKGYIPTEHGRHIIETAKRIQNLLGEVSTSLLDEQQLSGELLVTTIEPLIPLLLSSFKMFRESHPNRNIVVETTTSLSKLEYGEAHIAFRAGTRPTHLDYIVHPFKEINARLYAHPSYITQYGKPLSVQDLARHHFVLPRKLERHPSIKKWIESHIVENQISCQSNSYSVIQQAVEEAFGIGILISPASRSSLVPILPEVELSTSKVWMVTHVNLHRTKKIQEFIKVIKQSSLLSHTKL